jgi:ABC-type branched-subunit amino acid transport system ATPase component
MTVGLLPLSLIAREIWQTLRALRDEGMAIAIVDKNFAPLSQIARRRVIPVKGRKVFDAPPAELAAQPGWRAQLLGV